MPRNSFVQGFNFIRTLGNSVYAIKEIKKTWFLDQNFIFSKDMNRKFGPKVANEIYYCPKYQFQTPKKVSQKLIKV